jgi:serine protease Do
MPRSSTTHILFAVVFANLILPPAAAAGQAPSRAALASEDLSTSLQAVTRQVEPAVVEIFTTSYTAGEGVVPSTGDLVTTQHASGSGVIVDPEGYIITNAHVVRGTQRLRVALTTPVRGRSILAARSRTVNATLVGIDLETDLAVVKVDERNLTAVSFADSDELRAGQIVTAFGSPLGLHNSASMGVVAAVARQLQPESPMIYVQTDASINPGSSGGPLVDLRGRIVGINTLIFSRAGGYEGVGFAAPSNIVKTVYEQIRKVGRVRRGDIGIRAQTITPVLASGLGLARDYGVVLADVFPGSPAARAGLRPGDLVLAMDGKAMENGRQLQVSLYRRLAGDVISLEILRSGRTMTLPVAMAERHDPFGGLAGSADPRENLVPRLGILGVTLDSRLVEALPVVRVPSGVVVVSTEADAIDPREGGLAAGDVIFSLNGTLVNGLAELRAALDRLTTGDPVVLQLERRGELRFLAFSIE